MMEQVKAGTYQVFDGDEDTRHRINLSFLKMGGLPVHEGRANLVDCTLISRFFARRGACQIILKMPILRTDDPSSQHSISNGFVEGKNNRLKALRRQGYGYRNRRHLRLRILLGVASCIFTSFPYRMESPRG
jgi:Transposase